MHEQDTKNNRALREEAKTEKEKKRNNNDIRKKRLMSLSIYFTIVVMATLAFVVSLLSIFTYILNNVFHMAISIPTSLWLFAVCLMVGFIITSILSRMFFGPITKLTKAMSDVADGNFDIRLDSKMRFREIQDIYGDFNTMAEELGATEILRSDFVSNVSHEFKTPINAIEGYATLLQGCENVTPEQQEYVEKIMLNTKRLSGLVSNILLLTKVDNQVIEAKTKLFRLDEQIRQSLLMLESKWTEKDIEFDVDLENIMFDGNESLTAHIWNNLLDNAIKFSPIGGVITMKLIKKDGSIFFSIEDEGPGIGNDAEKKHIFDKFYQGDSSHKEEGNGLGLALVKKIVDGYNGVIMVENAENGGAIFTIVL